MKYRGIMLLGTASSVGKSTVAAAFCRYFKKKGYSVAPYKALNISLNSFVTKEGDEIGRAQVVQAEACEIDPKEYMNPILMKPSAGFKTQVIVRGKVYCTMDAYKYKDLNKYLKEKAKEAYDDISKDYDLIVLEGSGSCAEINLRETDIANMQTAKMADADVILVADIDRGGVFASIVGTIMLLTEEERKRVKGVIINKFRGKKEFFEPAMRQIEEIINIPVLGVMPYFDLDIEEEDSASIKIREGNNKGVDIAIVRLPHMSNFTDFNALSRIKDVGIRYAENTKDLDNAHMIIIPGSKNTIDDLIYLKESGFKDKILEKKAEGKLIFGICGGYQILGEKIIDSLGVEGSIREEEGLGLLNIKTSFNKQKTTKQVIAFDSEGNEVSGYEIHNGESIPTKEELVWLKDQEDNALGMKDEASKVLGTYIHGIFDEGDFGIKLINKLKKELNLEESHEMRYKDYKISQYNKLCELLEENIDMDYVENLIRS
ncbi:cobyric acid synthase [Clostridium sp. LIBA-8841]|uniref:cobyric acid synthase n=1 Tax=Clostridium sp. LIBA-8841 TaxID=2987530 RepID=UPI002AC46DD3|nr:cobyric acid synthase [Clostridium sp. LIBA-8841]MDZ5253342.1 cobyric acid synthase [Clostridium sp. LIBA-8841]